MTNAYLLVDGNNLAMRSLHASIHTTGLSTVDGVPTAALMIFANSFSKLVQDFQPTHIAVAWDGPRSAYRTALLPTYKANRKTSALDLARPDAFHLMQTFLGNCGVGGVMYREFEADDLIAGWWHAIESPTTDSLILIASGDKDLLQLVGHNPYGVLTVAHRFGDQAVWDSERFEEEMGYYPERWPLVAALMGDNSDNILGVRGIGPKKAVKLLERHDWDLDRVLTEELPEHRERILINFKLMDLQQNCLVELPAPQPTELNTYTGEGDVLDEFFGEFELAALRGRYRRGQLWSMPQPVGRAFRSSTTKREEVP